jgi:hypothetical protein
MSPSSAGISVPPPAIMCLTEDNYESRLYLNVLRRDFSNIYTQLRAYPNIPHPSTETHTEPYEGWLS